ncbi:MAG: cupin domain-containing protein [Pseudomonadota bacterium]
MIFPAPIRVLACAALVIATLSAASTASAKDAQDAAAQAIAKVDLRNLAVKPIAAFTGVSSAFIRGSFSTPGLYAAQGLMAKGSTFPPHAHPDVRFSIVISGTMYLGQGKTFDAAKLVAYPAGTMAITPANTPHFMSAPDGDVRILEIGSGPSGNAFFGD